MLDDGGFVDEGWVGEVSSLPTEGIHFMSPAESEVEFSIVDMSEYSSMDDYSIYDDFSYDGSRWSYYKNADWSGGSDDFVILTPGTASYQDGLITYNTPISTATDWIIEFSLYAKYAHGTCFFMLDGETSLLSSAIESEIESLGYSSISSSKNGLPNAYLGVGFDEYGNFNTTLTNGPGGRINDSVVLAGSGNGTSEDGDYRYLTHSKVTDLDKNIDGEWNDVRIIFTSDEHITVMMSWDEGETWHTLIDDFDVGNAEGQAALPETVTFGFSATTPHASGTHYIDTVRVTPLHHMRTRTSPTDEWSAWIPFIHEAGSTPSLESLSEFLTVDGGFTESGGVYSNPVDLSQIDFNVASDGNLYVRLQAADLTWSDWTLVGLMTTDMTTLLTELGFLLEPEGVHCMGTAETEVEFSVLTSSVEMRTRTSSLDSWTEWVSFTYEEGAQALIDLTLFLTANNFMESGGVYSNPVDASQIDFNEAGGNLYFRMQDAALSWSDWIRVGPMADTPTWLDTKFTLAGNLYITDLPADAYLVPDVIDEDTAPVQKRVMDQETRIWGEWTDFGEHNTVDFRQALVDAGYRLEDVDHGMYYTLPSIQPEVEVFVSPSYETLYSDVYTFTDDFSDSFDWTLSDDAFHDYENDWLVLTPDATSQFGMATYTTPWASDQGIAAEFDYYAGDGTGGDGIVFFLADGATDSIIAGDKDGFNLGYNGETTGLSNGYLGIGFDEWGGFGGVPGGIESQPNCVTLRGSTADYSLLEYTSVSYLGGIDGGWRRVRVLLTSDERLTVKMSWDKGATWHTFIDSYDVGSEAGQIDLPETLKFGFTGTTSVETNNHWVDNVIVGTAVDYLAMTDSLWTVSGDASKTEHDQVLLTPDTTDQTGMAVYDGVFPSAQGFVAEFDYYAWDSWGGDGIVFFMADAEAGPLTMGANMGYGNTTEPGIPGAWLGIVFDEYGDFSANASGGPTDIVDQVVVAGCEALGYQYLDSSVDADIYGGINGGIRRVRVTLTSDGYLTVEMKWSDDTDWHTMIDNLDLAGLQGAPPETLRLGFTADTGPNENGVLGDDDTNEHSIDNFTVQPGMLLRTRIADAYEWSDWTNTSALDVGAETVRQSVAALLAAGFVPDGDGYYQAPAELLQTRYKITTEGELQMQIQTTDENLSSWIPLGLYQGDFSDMLLENGYTVESMDSDLVYAAPAPVDAYLVFDSDGSSTGQVLKRSYDADTESWDEWVTFGEQNTADFIQSLTDATYQASGFSMVYDGLSGSITQTQILVMNIPGEDTGPTMVRERSQDDALYSTYYIDVSGWNDKYIRMPIGAQENVLRVVSQGESSAFEQTVGDYVDIYNIRQFRFDDGATSSLPIVPVDTPDMGNLYYYIPGSYTWYEAQEKALFMGGYLATITSPEEQNMVQAVANGNPAWIGMDDSLTEGVYQWTTGESVTHTNWYTGEPDGSGDFVAINLNETGMWSDLPYNDGTPVGYILEIEAEALTTDEFGLRTMYIPSEVGDGFSWYDAQAHAGNYGGTLLPVGSVGDNDLATLVANGNQAWIGLYDSGENEFGWSNYDSLIYTNWDTAGGEPDGLPGDADYAYLDASNSGLWFDAEASESAVDGYVMTVQGGNSIYEYVSGSYTFDEANAMAVARGGHLVTITSEFENHLVTGLIDDGNYAWIGLYDPDDNNTFEWMTGESVSYTNWQSGQPSLGTSEQYARLYGDTGSWYDEIEGTNSGFIMEKPLTVFEYISGKFSWEEAVADAALRGGYLASIQTDRENVLAGFELLNQGLTSAWIGAHDSIVEEDFMWVSHELFDETVGTYTAWASGEPVSDGGLGADQDVAQMVVTDSAIEWENVIDDFDHRQGYILEKGLYTSGPYNVVDASLTLNYQWVSDDYDIYDKQPKFETFEIEVKSVETKTISLWKTVPDVTSDTLLEAVRIYDESTMPCAVFDGETVSAGGALTIEAGGVVDIGGSVKAETGNVTLEAAGDITVEGVMPVDVSDPENTIPAVVEITATAGNLTVISGGKLTVDWSDLLANAGSIDLIAGTDAAITNAVMSALTDITVTATGDVTLSAKLTAGDLIDLHAGAGLLGASCELTADTVSLTADAGDITLTDTFIEATTSVTATASTGSVTLPMVITATLVGRSATDFAAEGTFADADVEVSDQGDITLISASALTLSNVTATDGAISVTATGDITATSLATLTDNDQNDITLITRADTETGASANLDMDVISAAGEGDVTLDIQGVINQVGGAVTANQLTVVVTGALALTTTIDELVAQITGVGDMAVTQTGTKALELSSVVITNGSLTVDHAAGDVTLTEVILSTNNDDNDMTVTAGGDILIDYVNVGIYAADLADVPEPEGEDAETGITSHGDIVLTAGGVVTEYGMDDDIDLIADTLVLSAQTGVTDLEVALNEITDLTTASGDITISEFDGEGEKTSGLTVTSATAPGNVTLSSEHSMTVEKVTGVTISLESAQANLELIAPTSGDAIEATSGVILNAGKVITSYAFFDAPDWVEYRAGDGFDFDLPDITSTTLILQTGDTLSIDGNLTATDYLELVSDSNIFVTGTITGPIAEVVISATGERAVMTPERDEETGLSLYTDGFINVYKNETTERYYQYQDGVEDRYYQYGYYQTEAQWRNYFTVNADGTGDWYADDNTTLIESAEKDEVTDLAPALLDVTDETWFDVEALSAQEVDTSGNINIQATGLPADEFTIRAAKDIFIEVVDDFAVNGFVGGIEGYDPARDITLRTEGTLTVTLGVINATGDMELSADLFDAGTGSVFMATNLTVNASSDIALNVLVDTLTAESTSGNIDISEVDDVVLESVVAQDGSVTITAGGDITADYVRTVTDGEGKDIILKSAGTLYVNSVEAGSSTGVETAYSEVTLDAPAILEASPWDNDLSVEGSSMIDVRAWKIHFLGTTSDPVTVTNSSMVGTGDELEILPTDAVEPTTTGATTMDGAVLPPSIYDGNYIVVLPDFDPSQNIDFEITGTLIVLQLPTQDGQEIRFKAGGDIIVICDLNVGSGLIALDAGSLTGGGISGAGTITADRLGVYVTDEDFVLDTEVAELSFGLNGTSPGTVTISQTGDLEITSGDLASGGEVGIAIDGTLTLSGTLSGADTVNMEATDDLIITGDIDVGATGTVNLVSGGTITGNSPADIQAAEVSITASGDVELRDPDDLTITELNLTGTDQWVYIETGGLLTLEDNITSDTKNIDFQTHSLTLAPDVALSTNTGSINLTSTGGNMNLSDGVNISSVAGNVTVDVTGDLIMTDATVIDAGSGALDIQATGHITLGYELTTTNSDPIIITAGGALVDGGDSPSDIIAPNAEVQITSVGGIGSDNAIEIEADKVKVTNTGGGDVIIHVTGDVTVQKIEQVDDGNIILRATGIITVDGEGITTVGTGSVTLDAQGNAAGIILNAPIVTAGGEVALITQSGDIELSAGIEVNGTGDILLQAVKGSILNTHSHWLNDGVDFDPIIEDALTQNNFTVEIDTGRILTDDTIPVEIRAAEGPYLQTLDGGIRIQAQNKVGEPMDGFTISPLSIVLDAETLSVANTSGDDIYIISLGPASFGEVVGEMTDATGAVVFVNLTGDRIIESPYDAGGEDIVIDADDVIIADTVTSDGGTIEIASRDPDAPIAVGDGDTTDFSLDTTELGLLTDGFAQIVIGDEEGSHAIQIGDETTPGVVSFTDPLLVQAPVAPGRVDIYGELLGTDNASLTVIASEIGLHDATITMPGDILLRDRIIIDGTASITGENMTFAHEIDGGELTLDASGDVVFSEGVGTTDPLDGLTISNADHVTFSQALVVDGPVVIYATGTVTFDGPVTIANGGSLTIIGADEVVFSGEVTGVVDMEIYTDTLTIAEGVTLSGTGTLTIAPITDTRPLVIGATPTDPDQSLNIDTSVISEFSQMIIGVDGQTIGTIEMTPESTDPLFTMPVEIYGGSVTVVDTDYALKATDTLTIDVQDAVNIYNSVESTGDISITSGGGIFQRADEVDGLATEPIITPNLSVTAATDIDLPWMQVGTIDVATTGGEISITQMADTGDLDVVGLLGTDNIVVTVEGGSLILSSPVNVTGEASLNLFAANDLAITHTLNTDSGDMTLEAGSALTQNVDLTSTSGNITIVGNVVTMIDGVVTQTTGDIGYTSESDLALSILNAGGTSTVNALSITDGLTGDGANIMGGAAVLTAEVGITLQTDMDVLSATNTSTAGNIAITQPVGDLEIINLVQQDTAGDRTIVVTTEAGSITVSGEISTAGTGAIILNANTNITVNDTIAVTSGAMTLDANTNITVNATLVATSGIITLDATHDIEINGSVSTTTSAIDLNAGNSVSQTAHLISISGGITVDAAVGDIIMGDGSKTMTSSGVDYTAAGNLAVCTIQSGDVVSMTATAGEITDNTTDEDVNIMATDLILTAGTAIGGAGDADLEITVSAITAVAQDGGVYLNESDGLVLTSVTATGAGNDVIVSCDTGDISVVSVISPDTVTLIAVEGGITDLNDTDADITANGVALSAATGIGSVDALELFADTWAAENTTSGDINLSSVSGALVSVGVVDGVTGLSNSGGDSTVIADDLAVDAAMVVTNDGLLTVTTPGDLTLAAGVTLTAETGAVNLEAGVAITMDATTVIAGGDAEISLIAQNDSTLSTITTTGKVFIESVLGGIVDTGASAVTADELTIRAVTGVGDGAAIAIDAETLDVVNSGVGAVNLVEADEIAIEQIENTGAISLMAGDTITLTGSITTVDGALTLDTNGSLEMNEGATIATDSGITDLTAVDDISVSEISSNTGDIIVISGGAIIDITVDENANFAARGEISLTAETGIGSDEDIDVSAATLIVANNTSGDVQIDSEEALTLGAMTAAEGMLVTIDAGDLSVTGDITAGGDIALMADTAAVIMTNSVVQSGADIAVTGATDVALFSLVSTAGGDITVTAAEGQITDNNATATSDLATDGAVILSAATGIGDSNALETAVGSLSAESSLSGNVEISEADGLLLDGATTADGDIILSTDTGSLLINDDVNASGIVTITGAAGLSADATMAASEIMFADTMDMDGNALTLDVGETGTITLSGDLSGGGALIVVDGAVQSYAGIAVDSLAIQNAGLSVTFNGEVSATGTIDVVSSGALVQTGAVTSGTNLDYDADTIAISEGITVAGDVTLDADTSITLSAEGDISASGDVIVGADKADALSTAGDIISGGTITITPAVNQTGAMRVEAVGALLFVGTVDTGANDLTLSAVGDIAFSGALSGGGVLTVETSADQTWADLSVDALDIQAATGAITFDGTVDVTGAMSVTGSACLIINETVTVGSDVTITSGCVTQNADITAGTVAVEATAEGIVMADGTTASATGAIYYLAAQDVALSLLSTDADIAVTATDGEIINNLETDEASNMITVGSVTLMAGGDIGAENAIHTAATSLSAVSTNGKIVIHESDGLTLTGVQTVERMFRTKQNFFELKNPLIQGVFRRLTNFFLVDTLNVTAGSTSGRTTLAQSNKFFIDRRGSGTSPIVLVSSRRMSITHSEESSAMPSSMVISSFSQHALNS